MALTVSECIHNRLNQLRDVKDSCGRQTKDGPTAPARRFYSYERSRYCAGYTDDEATPGPTCVSCSNVVVIVLVLTSTFITIVFVGVIVLTITVRVKSTVRSPI